MGGVIHLLSSSHNLLILPYRELLANKRALSFFWIGFFEVLEAMNAIHLTLLYWFVAGIVNIYVKLKTDRITSDRRAGSLEGVGFSYIWGLMIYFPARGKVDLIIG